MPPGAGKSCPHCGDSPDESGAGESGVFQTSAVFIAAEGAEMVYRSVDDVPHGLRTKLFKSTNSANSATILIADRRGREEMARAMRSLGRSPGRGRRRALGPPLRALLAGRAVPGTPEWLTRRRKLALLALVLMLVLAVIALLFTHS
jgi:hypothetical protein